MVSEKTAMTSSPLNGLLRFSLYKPNQGRLIRQTTFAAIVLFVVLGSWSMKNTWGAQGGDNSTLFTYAVPGVVLVVGLWIGYRLLNMPRFADFLIAVEAEMNKVTWPTRTELVRSSIVVILVIGALAIILFGYDIVWRKLFEYLGVLQTNLEQ